jgi:predicted NBD/HSP70 family sugar kinase
MGSGVGGGVVVNGHVIGGRHGIGGEWGHNVLEENGADCYCGRKGCVEAVFSGPALERYYKSLTNKELRLKNIVENYYTGNDEAAKKTMQRLIHFFGKAVGPIINILDPEVIVIGGGVGNIDLLYTEGVEEVKKYVFNPSLETLFLKPSLGDSAGVFGAALL